MTEVHVVVYAILYDVCSEDFSPRRVLDDVSVVTGDRLRT